MSEFKGPVDMQEFRRKQNNLVVSGAAVISFCLWSVFKSLTHTLFPPAYMQDAGQGNGDVTVGYMIFWGIFTGIDLLIRFRVGRNAIAEGKGEKPKKRYTGWALFMAIMYTIGVVIGIIALIFTNEGASSTLIAAIIVDITAVFVLIELLRSVSWIRKAKKAMAAEQAT